MESTADKVHGDQAICEYSGIVWGMSVWMVWDGRCGRMCGVMKSPVDASKFSSLDCVGFSASRGVDEMGDTEMNKGGTQAVWERGVPGGGDA
jgi:hypothetical protein